MNWEFVRFDWNQARAFLVAASEGSLSAAAKKLGQTQPTLSRQVAALEQELGVTLFERVGRRLALTQTGTELLEHVQRMAEAAGHVSLSAQGRSELLEGEIRISTGEAVAAYLMPQIIERLHAVHPEITVHLVVSNQLSDLLRREADVAIRHVRPEQPDLVARKVREASAHLYGARSWIERHGHPKTPDDLQGAVFVGGEDNEQFVGVLNKLGIPVSLPQFRLTTDSHVAGWEMIRRGLGIGGMLGDIAARTAGVEELLPNRLSIPVPYWVCAHREVHTSRRIRVVFDLLAEAFASLGESPSFGEASQES